MTTEFTTGVPGGLRAFELVQKLLVELAGLAHEHAQRAAQRRKEARRPRKGGTLRPGDETPLWFALIDQVRPHLRVRGAKSNLARVLEVPRQRVNDYFVSRTKMPDAERILHILLWLASRETESPAPISPKPSS